ncbi:hypothetical protein [Simplicispira psychrophila]|uniref:hypothetical protein n=1 Tax=Simplicispira psychrophila TaxID=80882 RepID=UPI000487BB8D|nr:hypothetical protein [Simplicispira psychrophila]
MQNSLQKLTKKYSLITSMALAISLLTGCANTFAPVAAEDLVSQRAQQRVDLLLDRKYDQAYEYLAPSYRALNSVESYRGRFGDGAKWIDPKVANVECPTEDRCVVKVKLKVLVVARGFGKPIDSNMSETWLKEDGQWWYYQY